MSDAIKFPKTPRLAEVVSTDIFPTWVRKHVTAVVEEKVDGANVGVWFDRGALRLQSRGHVLRGGAGEEQFAAFHGWAASRLVELQEVLGNRFVLYGEWCFAKHKAFYDALPDWFLGYDVRDSLTGWFLNTESRDKLLRGCRVQPVARLWSGDFGKAPGFGTFIGPSRYKTVQWRVSLAEAVSKQCAVPLSAVMQETDDSDMAEGVYVRIEGDSGLIGRMKLHRHDYTKVPSDHWRSRPIIRNRLVGSAAA
jgi:hypothetical protein